MHCVLQAYVLSLMVPVFDQTGWEYGMYSSPLERCVHVHDHCSVLTKLNTLNAIGFSNGCYQAKHLDVLHTSDMINKDKA